MPNDITVTKNTTSGSERWDVQYTADAAHESGSPIVKTMNTKNTVLDRDIRIAITNPSGTYSASVDSHSITTTPVVTPSIGGNITDITSTSAPSGTNGTDYWTLDPGGSVTTTGVSTATGKATISSAGFIATGNTTSSNHTVNITPTIAAGTNRYLAKGTATVAGGGLTVGANYTGTPTVSIALDSQSTSGIAITDTAQSSGYYVKLVGSTAALTGTTTVNRAAITLARTAGYVTAQTATNVSNATSSSPTVTVNGASTTSYLTLPTATFTVSDNKVYCDSGGWVPTGSASSAVGTITTQTPTTSYAYTGLETYFNAGTSGSNNVSITPRYSNNAGYVAAHSNTNNGGVGYWSIKTTSRTAGTGTVTLTAGAGSATLTVGTGDSASSSNPSMEMATSTPSSGVYYTLTAKGKGTVSGAGSGQVSTGTGWVTSGTTSSNTSASSSETSNEATTYGYILKSVHGNAVSGSLPTSLTRTEGTYQDIEIQPYGYVKIPKGYNPIDKYVFANRADASGEANAASGYTLSVSSISGNSAVTVGTLSSGYYPITANNLSVTATLSAGTAGWFSSGSATDSDTDGVTVGKIAAGSATGPTSLSASSATVTTGTNTITLTKTGVTTTPTVTAGYVPSATASSATVALTASVTTKAAATYTPTTSDQTIAASTYLTGAQTIKGDANLIADNIKSGTTIFGVTGTYVGSQLTITDEADSHGGTIRHFNLTQDANNEYAWLGFGATLIGTQEWDLPVSSTSYSSWTASTSASNILAAETSNHFSYTYNRETESLVFVQTATTDYEYVSGATLKAIPKRTVKVDIAMAIGAPSTLTQHLNNTLGTQTYVATGSLHRTQYYDSSSNQGISTAYGIYPAGPTITSSYSNGTVTAGFRRGIVYARCNSTVFATARKPDIDTATKIHFKIDVYKVPKANNMISTVFCLISDELNKT